MSSVIQIQTGQFRFNFTHLLILIAIAASIFLLSNLLTLKHVAETAPVFSYEDIAGLAGEIYDTGAITDAVKDLPLDAAIIEKMSKEIGRILAKTIDYPGCEVYYLHARVAGNYPVLGYGDVILGYEYLNVNDVWKVGQTCKEEQGRYSSNTYFKSKDGRMLLTNKRLRYQYVCKNTYKSCLILEKVLIYTYPLWSGHSNLSKPPGCKIFR